MKTMLSKTNLLVMVLYFSSACVGQRKGGKDRETFAPPFGSMNCTQFEETLNLLKGQTESRESIFKMVVENKEKLKSLEPNQIRVIWACLHAS
jgi:hypothetical protein